MILKIDIQDGSMNSFFDKNFTGSAFELFGAAHLVVLSLLAVMIVFLIYLRKCKSGQLNSMFRIIVAAVLIIDELLYHLWNMHIQEWTLQKMLPLHLCSVFVWLCAIMLLTKSRQIYEFAYFLGIGGALQVMLTPDIGDYNFPHFRFFQVFLSHGLIITSALYMTIVEGMRPTLKSFARVFIWLNVYVVFVFFINLIVGGNYLYIMQKPETASLLDALGPWPVYIIASEAVAFITFLFLYAPFWFCDLFSKGTARTTSP